MKIDSLKEFIVLAETCNFLEAAEQLYVSQSTLSRHMQSLETELRTVLFERTTRKVKLSADGQILLPYAQEMVSIYEECDAAIAEKLSHIRTSLKIGCTYTLIQDDLIDILIDFQKKNTNFAVNIFEADSYELRRMLLAGECDYAFVREADENMNGLKKILCLEDEFVAILPANHPLAKSSSICLKQLENEQFVLPSEETAQYRLCVKACKDAGFVPKTAYMGYGGNLIALVKEEGSVSILPKKSCQRHLDGKISVIDIVPKITTNTDLICAKDRQPSIAGKRFLQFLRSSIDSKQL